MLRFSSLKDDGKTVALAIVPQAKVEAALRRGKIEAEDLRTECSPKVGQWSRWMRTEIGLLIDGIVKGRIDYEEAALREHLEKRIQRMEQIAAMPCGVEHASGPAALAAAAAMAPVLKALGDGTMRANEPTEPTQSAKALKTARANFDRSLSRLLKDRGVAEIIDTR